MDLSISLDEPVEEVCGPFTQHIYLAKQHSLNFP